jgi:hypothetical protein
LDHLRLKSPGLIERRADRDCRQTDEAPQALGSRLRCAGISHCSLYANAQLAGEMSGHIFGDRWHGFDHAITTDGSVLTAIGNDHGYERLFERQGGG